MLCLSRAVLLGKDPYSQDEPLQRRPGHVNGTLLNNVVVGTVRLRQKRVRLECHRRSQIELPHTAMLCYAPDIWDGESKKNWSWPRFLATTNETATTPAAAPERAPAAPHSCTPVPSVPAACSWMRPPSLWRTTRRVV